MIYLLLFLSLNSSAREKVITHLPALSTCPQETKSGVWVLRGKIKRGRIEDWLSKHQLIGQHWLPLRYYISGQPRLKGKLANSFQIELDVHGCGLPPQSAGKLADEKGLYDLSWVFHDTTLVRPLTWPASLSEGTVKLSLAFGKIDKIGNHDLREYAQRKDWTIAALTQDYQRSINKVEVGYLGVKHFLLSIAGPHRNIKVLAANNESLQIEIATKQARQKYVIDVFYGDVSRSFAQFVIEALEDSSMFFYIGHSGEGKNLDLRALAELAEIDQQDLREKLRRRPYLLYVVIGCHSLRYFGADLLTYRKGLATDLWRSAGVRYFTQLPAALLRSFDSNPHHLVIPEDWLKLDPLLLERAQP